MLFPDLLKYGGYAYSLGLLMFLFSVSNDLRNAKFKRRTWRSVIIALVLGAFLLIISPLSMDRASCIVIMSAPLVFLSVHQLLFNMFKAKTGLDPYATFRNDKIGGKPLDGFWSKWEDSRTIRRSDFNFTLLQVFVPILVVVIIAIILFNILPRTGGL